MSERSLIASMLADREAYVTVSPRLREGDLSEQGRLIVEHIGDYYERDGSAGNCDPEILSRNVGRALGNPKHKEQFAQLISDLAGIEVSPSNVVHDFLAVRREAVGAKVAQAILGGKSEDDILPLMEEFSTLSTGSAGNAIEVLQGPNVRELVEDNFLDGNLIKVMPKSLNDRLDGGCLPGHHIVVFARPEMGKTLFLVNAIAGFLAQDLKVLYVGNEDPVQDIALRVVCRLAGMTKFEVFDNLDDADDVARVKGYDNLTFASLTPGTPRELEALIQDHAPQVILIDQLRNLNMNEENAVQKLEKAATAARNIAKKHKILVSLRNTGG